MYVPHRMADATRIASILGQPLAIVHAIAGSLWIPTGKVACQSTTVLQTTLVATRHARTLDQAPVNVHALAHIP